MQGRRTAATGLLLGVLGVLGALLGPLTSLTAPLAPSSPAPRLTALRLTALRIGVSAPIYESPGGVVPAIVTVYGVPAGYHAAISARGTDAARVACIGAEWRNHARDTVSRRCYLWLPRTRGAYNVIGRATLTRKGSPTLRVAGRGERPVQANGVVSKGDLSLDQIRAVQGCGNTTSRVWLTFDDGGSHSQVSKILDTLRNTGVRGRFFFTGTWRDNYPALLQRIKREGHVLGNHTATHQPLSKLGADAVRSQIRRGISSTARPRLLRPPYGAGAFSARLARLAALEGYTVCRWTADTYDWDRTTLRRMVERIRHGDYRSPPLEAGGNLLMHGTAAYTVAGLRQIIRAVREKGLRLDRLP